MRCSYFKGVWLASLALIASACVTQTEAPTTKRFSTATYGSVGGATIGQVNVSRDDLRNFAFLHEKGWNAMVSRQFGSCASKDFSEGVRMGTKTRHGFPTIYFVKQPYGAPSNSIASRVMYQLSIQETSVGVDFVEFARDGEPGVIAAKEAARTLISAVSRDKFSWLPGCDRKDAS